MPTPGNFFIPRLETLRQKAHVTISLLAQLAGVSRATISKVERGQDVSLATVHRILDALEKLHPNLDRNREFVFRVDQTQSRKQPKAAGATDLQDKTKVGGAAILYNHATDIFHSLARPDDGPLIPLPLQIGICVGDASETDLSELFHELSTLYRMVGGSGLSYYFEDSREFVRVTA